MMEHFLSHEPWGGTTMSALATKKISKGHKPICPLAPWIEPMTASSAFFLMPRP